MTQPPMNTNTHTWETMATDCADSEKTPSLTSFSLKRPNTVSAKLNLPETYIENTGLNSVLCKREINNFRSETKLMLASLSEELFQLKIKQKMLLRKESELDYQLQDAILQEEYYRRSEDMAHLVISSNGEEMDDIVRLKEARLFQEMMEITSMRNQLLIDLDIEKLREEEEDKEILEEYYSLKRVWQHLKTYEPQATPTLAGKHSTDAQRGSKKVPPNGQKHDHPQSRPTMKNRRKFGKLGCVLF